MKKNVLLSTILLVFAIGFISCENENKEKDKIKEGNLSGSTWSNSVEYSGSISGYNYMYTFKFTSETAGTVTRTGWAMVNGKRQDVNDSQSFVYIYSPELRQGVITFTSGGIYKTGNYIFSISDDFREMDLGSNTFELK